VHREHELGAIDRARGVEGAGHRSIERGQDRVCLGGEPGLRAPGIAARSRATLLARLLGDVRRHAGRRELAGPEERQLLARERAHALEQPRASLGGPPGEQRLVAERLHQGEPERAILAEDRDRGVDREVAPEQREPRERPPLFGLEERPRPLDRAPQRRLPRRRIAPSVGQHVERSLVLTQHRRQRARAHERQPARCELERERNALEAMREGREDRRFSGRRRVPARAREEQCDALRREDRFVVVLADPRQRQGRDLERGLARDPEELS
jgi:hypothetical protein